MRGMFLLQYSMKSSVRRIVPWGGKTYAPRPRYSCKPSLVTVPPAILLGVTPCFSATAMYIDPSTGRGREDVRAPAQVFLQAVAGPGAARQLTRGGAARRGDGDVHRPQHRMGM